MHVVSWLTLIIIITLIKRIILKGKITFRVAADNVLAHTRLRTLQSRYQLDPIIAPLIAYVEHYFISIASLLTMVAWCAVSAVAHPSPWSRCIATANPAGRSPSASRWAGS